ncbi:MAG: Holliday junction branch migration DNA helicase RuvB [Candidatus Kerfeldbacteria bacterium]|nr:Holliday junction branch migration DNA helicase RuvB [Candidatus Kerfeldbacteria bacterium]
MSDRVINPTQQRTDTAFDATLRPTSLTDYIGQQHLKDNLAVFLGAARQRNEVIEHVLLHGGPGLGKTTLAHIVAKEMNVNIRVTSGAAIERAGDLAAILTNLGEGDILFIDEIHRLPRTIEEVLYPAMEDYALDVIIGKGPSARTLRLDLPHFTIIGATTRVSLLSAPLRDRFGVQYKLEFYTPEEMTQIVKRSAQLLQLQLAAPALTIIASRARSTPRIANRLLKRVRDYAQVNDSAADMISDTITDQALQLLNIDQLGLDAVDRKLLTTIIENFRGGPVGIQTLAATIGEDIAALETVYEPFLLQIGFLTRTPRGRMATEAAYRHLNRPVPTDLQSRLL